MSKIPQGEWNAIAARYQNGETISQIARSYRCTPPAIHYILKRNRLRPVSVAPAARPAPLPAEIPGSPPLHRRVPAAAPPAAKPDQPVVGMRLVQAHSAIPGPSLRAAAEPPVRPSNPLSGLDSALHRRAEVAIELFRSSFDAALSEGSPVVCAQLREAASDLMRVAARTTIVLDRLSALAERSGWRPVYPRSANARDDFAERG